jgi:CTP synthase
MALSANVDCDMVEAEELEGDSSRLDEYDGVLVTGGFGARGVEGKIAALHEARVRGIPCLGICLGMQCMVIEFARNVLNLKNANSTEFDETTPYPVIHLMDSQLGVSQKGGTMRLGAYPCALVAGTRSAALYGKTEVSERHRHRFELNNAYRQALEEGGMKIAGMSPDRSLVEIVEISDAPFYVGCQFHPEFKSRPFSPHPLFMGLVEAALRHQEK